MKRLLISLLCLLPLSASAASFQAGNAVEVKADGNAYAAGSVVQVTEIISGDAFLAGESVIVNAAVEEDAFLAGKNIAINAAIADDLYAAGETIVVNGAIGGDAMLFGQKVVFAQGSSVAGDLFLGGNMVSVDGGIEGRARILASEVSIMGTIGKDTLVNVEKGFLIDTDASILGHLRLTAPEELSVNIPQGAVRGEVKRVPRTPERETGRKWGIIGGFSLFSLLSRILIGGILIALVRSFVMRFGQGIAERREYWRTLGLGFLLLILPPFAAIILLFPFLTIPLGILLFAAWGAELYAASLFSGVLAANLFFPLRREDAFIMLLGKFTLGTMILFLIAIVPFVGFLITFSVYLLSLGSLAEEQLRGMRALKTAKIL